MTQDQTRECIGVWNVREDYDHAAPEDEPLTTWPADQRWRGEKPRTVVAKRVVAVWVVRDGAWRLEEVRIYGPLRTKSGAGHATQQGEATWRRATYGRGGELGAAPSWLLAWARKNHPPSYSEGSQ